MKLTKLAAVVALGLAALILGGCGGSSQGITGVSPSTPDVGTQALPPSTLTLSLSTDTKVTDAGSSKATTITRADLLRPNGTVAQHGTVSAGSAHFTLTGMNTGFYFIRVNGDAGDLVPTKLDGATTAVKQFVGSSLRTTVIGSLASPTYMMRTFSPGQGWPAVVRYATGAATAPGRYAFATLYLNGRDLFQVRALETGALLSSTSLSGSGIHDDAVAGTTAFGGPHNPATWLFGASNHGMAGTSSCNDCHERMTTKPATYASVGVENGWCYKCHYGPSGSSTFVDVSTGTVPQPPPPPPGGSVLNLSLSTTLNGTGAVKAAAITTADLLNTAGAVAAGGTVASGKASFPLTGLTPGFYFIRVNGDANDLVPTKIDSVSATINQFVGTTLRRTVIGTLSVPTYQMTTYSLGQSQTAVVNYSNGTAGAPARYAFATLYSNGATFEVRVLGTAALLTTMTPGGPHAAATWIFGATNHGVSVDASCTGCHSAMTTKPASRSSVSAGNGWCYECHYGSGGNNSGFVDPAK